MSATQAMMPCKHCGRPTLHLVEKPNHILHLILSIVTLGAWLIVWLGVGLHTRDQDEICTICGNHPQDTATTSRPSTPDRQGVVRPSPQAISFGRALGRFFGRLKRK